MRMQTIPLTRTQMFGVSLARTHRCGAWRYELEVGLFNRMYVFYWGKGDE